MNDAVHVKKSEYMNWAKTSSSARFNLTTSGLANLKLAELSATLEDLEITSTDGYGYKPLLECIATRLQVDTSSVVTAMGTSFANHLAMAAMISPGDEVLLEHPTYEPLLALARYLGADVKHFPRRFEDQFQIVPAEIERKISARTRLIVITNLHNPSGVLTNQATLGRVAELAKGVGARVLVDEVYLETLFDRRPQTASLLGPELIGTSSLTKAFGLSGLRCGWIIAEPGLARRMWLLNDLFASTPVHAGERLSVLAFKELESIACQATSLLERNRVLVNQFLDSRSDLEVVRPEAGTIVFPRLKGGGADRFCSLLKEKYETSVVPGSFFGLPDHFRLGLAVDCETLASGLERVSRALDEFNGARSNTY